MSELHSLLTHLSREGNLVFLTATVAAYLVLETLIPLFPNRVPVLRRWYVNVSIHVINSVMAYALLFYAFGVGVEERVSQFGLGLFALMPGLPLWLQFVVFTLLADLAFYWLHRFYHVWRPFWRIHVVHHSDKDVDITDSFRIHPLQSLLEIIMRISVTLLLGVPIIVLIMYDLLYTLFVFYPHANIKVPRKIERRLRWVIVTSDMHRIHHSARPEETNSNYSDIFSFWDRMFGTYRFSEWDEQQEMRLGLGYFRSQKEQGLLRTLMQPISYRARLDANESRPD